MPESQLGAQCHRPGGYNDGEGDGGYLHKIVRSRYLIR